MIFAWVIAGAAALAIGSPAGAQALPRVEAAVSYIPRIMGSLGGSTLHGALHATYGNDDRRWIFGAGYGQELGSSRTCCLPRDDYRYRFEMAEASVGIETIAKLGDEWVVAADTRLNPVFVHEIRSASGTGVEPPSTVWKVSPAAFSFGGTARYPVGSLQFSVRGRLWLDLARVPFGGLDRMWAFGLGVGW